MPSINEVWEQALQINANLATIHNDLVANGNCCTAGNGRLDQLIVRTDETNDWLSEIRSLVASGFASVTAGIAGIQARQEVLIQIGVAQLDQGRSIICILENISRNTCALLNESDRQTDLQQGILSAGEQVAHMMATAHPDAALSWQRASEQQAALEECCPPAEAEPPCRYRPCEEPRVPDLPGLEAFEEMKAVRSKVKRVDRVERPS